MLYERCAGLDVHRDTVVATVRTPGARRGQRHSETKTFKTMQLGLGELGDWLVCERVELVVMEATGVYWKPVFAVLEDRLRCCLVNAAHIRNVPGCKTDVADSVWIARVGECGLVHPSFSTGSEHVPERIRPAGVDQRVITGKHSPVRMWVARAARGRCRKSAVPTRSQ